MSESKAFSLVVFLVVVMGVGLAIGYATAPGEWYAALEKPPFNPPNWVFGPVWTVIYAMIAVAAWRVWIRVPDPGSRVLWVIQMLLNWLWSPVFFGLQMPRAALVVIVLLLGTIIAFIVRTWPRDRVAAMLFVPYAAWVGFATLLNASIAILN